jgi:hypothetical protein
MIPLAIQVIFIEIDGILGSAGSEMDLPLNL